MAMIKGFKWVRPLTVERWVDGDTLYAVIDRGDGDLYRPVKGIRVLFADGTRFDTPESKDEPLRARRASLAAGDLLPAGSVAVSTSHQLDVYGRPLCSLLMADGRDFAWVMAGMGHLK